MNSLIDQLRQMRNKLIQRQQFQSAVFLSDKILAFKESTTEDVLVVSKCLFRLKEYQRAAYIITSKNLQHSDIACCCLVVKCYYKCKNYTEALELVKRYLGTSNGNLDVKFSNWTIPLLVMQSLLYQAIDNRMSAMDSLYKALELNFICYEAFHILTSHHMITKNEELELLNLLIKKNRDLSPFLCAFMRFFYYIQLKKYDKPDELELYIPFNIFAQNTNFLVSLAERHYYNCQYNKSLDITNSLLRRDLYNHECLLIHISCLVEFNKSNELFELAQKLIDLYPENEISWYSLGCYYHLIEKVDLSRRFLLKSTTLNNVFAPAWLLYGHSFSHESEHDQAMAAYFKASHLMPGCHLPLLYIGVEYILTDNFKLGEKFILKALAIAPEDPLVLHEIGIIAFHTNEVFKAERHFRTALKVLKYQQCSTLPNRYDALLNNMGHVLRKLGRYSDAIEFHKKALMLSPENPPSYSSIGLIYCMMGKWNEAVEYLDYAHGLNKLLRREDPHTKTLLDDALKHFTNVLRHNLSFDNKFNDKDNVTRLCNQSPKKINIKSKNDGQDMSIEDLSMMDDFSLDSSLLNNSLRIL